MNEPTVLLVEDDPSEALLLAIAFGERLLPVQTKYVYDGHEAVAYLKGEGRYANRSAHPFPDVVVIDLQLPDFSGLALLHWARKQAWLADLTVVLLGARDCTRLLSFGPNTHFIKSGDADALFRLLESLNPGRTHNIGLHSFASCARD
jgi:CheY-like chemotaxis protein